MGEEEEEREDGLGSLWKIERGDASDQYRSSLLELQEEKGRAWRVLANLVMVWLLLESM